MENFLETILPLRTSINSYESYEERGSWFSHFKKLFFLERSSANLLQNSVLKREILLKRKYSNTCCVQMELFLISLRAILEDPREVFSSVSQRKIRITLHC